MQQNEKFQIKRGIYSHNRAQWWRGHQEPLVPWQKEPKKPQQNEHEDFIPISYDKKYRTPCIPRILEENSLSLQSDLGKTKSLNTKQEVTLAALEVQLNKIKEDEEILPKLQEQW